MKIEMGESLFYSWLRHVKACQIVQTNWKVSQHWELKHEAEIEAMMKTIDNHFSSKYGYGIFKGNVSHRQLTFIESTVSSTNSLQQGMVLHGLV